MAGADAFGPIKKLVSSTTLTRRPTRRPTRKPTQPSRRCSWPCYVRMPSGCTTTLRETKTPKAWFLDPATKKLTCQQKLTLCKPGGPRAAAYNTKCKKSDAQYVLLRDNRARPVPPARWPLQRPWQPGYYPSRATLPCRPPARPASSSGCNLSASQQISFTSLKCSSKERALVYPLPQLQSPIRTKPVHSVYSMHI